MIQSHASEKLPSTLKSELFNSDILLQNQYG